MKCSHCDTANLKDSIFCENCGKKLGESNDKAGESQLITKEIIKNLDEVLFIPKKRKRANWLTMLGIMVVLGILGLIALALISSSHTVNTNTTDTVNQIKNEFNLENLILRDTKMFGNSGNISNPVFQGTLHNSSNVTAKDVVIRFNFFNTGEENAIPIDTQYVKVADILRGGDSASINTIVKTNTDTSGDFWWTVAIFSASASE
jgi:type II secretory pathway pseudopilin PulG